MKVMSYIRGGYGRSRNAQHAEEEGRFPLTRATPALRDALKAKGVKTTLKECRAALEASWDGEWHHTGKYGLQTGYYSLAEAEKLLLLSRAAGGVRATPE
jgi:hypothetical protein